MRDLMTKPAADAFRAEIADGVSLLDLARDWLQQGNPAVASELLDSAIRSPEADSDQHLRACILKETGRVKMMQSNWKQAESHYLEAQRIFLFCEDHKGAAECARNRSNALFQAGEFSQAEDRCGQALDWASRAGDYELRATILNTMGAIKSVQGATDQAVSTFRLCLADFRRAGNVIRQGYVLLNIGLAQIDLEQKAGAHDSLNQALAIALREKDQNLVEICYQNIARCYLAQKETRLAASVITSARKVLPGLNSKALERELELLEAIITRARGDLGNAEQMLEVMLPLVTEERLSNLVAEVLYEQAQTSVLLGDSTLARTKAEAAVEQYRSIGAGHGLLKAQELLKGLSA